MTTPQELNDMITEKQHGHAVTPQTPEEQLATDLINFAHSFDLSPEFNANMLDQFQSEVVKSQNRFSPTFSFAMAAAAVSVLIMVVAFTPTIKDFAQTVIDELFPRSTTNEYSYNVDEEITRTEQNPHVTFETSEELQANVDFEVRFLNVESTEYVLEAAYFFPNHNTSYLGYSSSHHRENMENATEDGHTLYPANIYIHQQPKTDSVNNIFTYSDDYIRIGSDAVVKEVQIGNYVGEVVQGAWLGSYPPDPDTEDHIITWDSEAPRITLRWQDNSFLYEISYWMDNYTQTEPDGSPNTIELERIASMAKSMMTGELMVQNPAYIKLFPRTSNTEYIAEPLNEDEFREYRLTFGTVEGLQEAVDFEIRTLADTVDVDYYSHPSPFFYEQHNATMLVYRATWPDDISEYVKHNGISVLQQPLEDFDENIFGSFDEYEGMIPENAEVIPVKVENYEGEIVHGRWDVVDSDRQKYEREYYWNQESMYHRLRWHDGEFVYQISIISESPILEADPVVVEALIMTAENLMHTPDIELFPRRDTDEYVQTRPTEEEIEEYRSQHITYNTISELHEAIDFEVKIPDIENYELNRIGLHTTSNTTSIYFVEPLENDCTATSQWPGGIIIGQQPRSDIETHGLFGRPDEIGGIGASAEIMSIQVGPYEGQAIQGGWGSQDMPDDDATEYTIEWRDNTVYYMIRWYDDTYVYTLSYSPGGAITTTRNDEYIDTDIIQTMIAFAENMMNNEIDSYEGEKYRIHETQTEEIQPLYEGELFPLADRNNLTVPLTHLELPTGKYLYSLVFLQNEAGFTIKLPEFGDDYELRNMFYDPAHNTARLYLSNINPSYPNNVGYEFIQQPLDDANENLFWYSETMQSISPQAIQTPIKIGDYCGTKVVGHWLPIIRKNDDDNVDLTWTHGNMVQVRWHDEEFMYEIRHTYWDNVSIANEISAILRTMTDETTADTYDDARYETLEYRHGEDGVIYRLDDLPAYSGEPMACGDRVIELPDEDGNLVPHTMAQYGEEIIAVPCEKD